MGTADKAHRDQRGIDSLLRELGEISREVAFELGFEGLDIASGGPGVGNHQRRMWFSEAEARGMVGGRGSQTDRLEQFGDGFFYRGMRTPTLRAERWPGQDLRHLSSSQGNVWHSLLGILFLCLLLGMNIRRTGV